MRSAVATLTILALYPTLALTGGLEAEFSASVAVGEQATLTITRAEDCCPGPPCPMLYGSGSGQVNWGDGTEETWYSWSSGPKPSGQGDQVNLAHHTYTLPGRYKVVVVYRYSITSDCEPVSVSLYDTLTVDVAPEPGQTGWLGIFYGASGNQCGPTSPGEPAYVVASSEGLGHGIGGAEFRLGNWNSNMLHTFSVLPQRIGIGSPFLGGISVAVLGCDAANSRRVPLIRIDSFPTVPGGSTTFTFLAPTQPTNPSFETPMLILCDSPFFTAISAKSGFSTLVTWDMHLASSECTVTEDVVAVEERTWTQVKSLFR